MEDNLSLHEMEIKAHLPSSRLCCLSVTQSLGSDKPQEIRVSDQEQAHPPNTVRLHSDVLQWKHVLSEDYPTAFVAIPLFEEQILKNWL